jgi:uncharacterized protein YecA (UPF0149 family)
MATSLRLPPALQQRATAAAADLGVSFNALVCVALSDYLDLRLKGASSSYSAEPTIPNPKPRPEFKAPKRRDDPCPCGSQANGYRLKWRQCHGRKGS